MPKECAAPGDAKRQGTRLGVRALSLTVLPRVLLFKVLAGACGVLVTLAVAAVALGALAKHRAIAAGADRGIVVQINHARIGWFSVHLEGVRVALEGIPDASGELGDVMVEVSAGGRPKRLVVHGGAIEAHGEPAKLLEEITAWRERHSAPSAQAGDGAKAARPAVDLAVSHVSVSLPLPEGGSLVAKEMSVERAGEGEIKSGTAGAGEIVATLGSIRATARDSSASFVGAKLHGASVGSLLVEVGTDSPTKSPGPGAPGSSAPSPANSAAPGEPPPPLLPLVNDKRGKKKSHEPQPPAEPIHIALPDVAPLRARAVALARTAADKLDDGADLRVAAVSLRIQSGHERITLGPGSASLLRTPEFLELSFATDGSVAATPGASKDSSPVPAPGKQGTPLSAKAELPLSGGELRLTLAGGPLTFAAVGVEEGAFGLIDVGRAELLGKASIILDGAGAMTFDADLTGRGLGMERAWLAPTAVHGLDVGVRLAGFFESRKRLRLDDAEVALGAARLRFRGTASTEAGEEEGRAHIAGSFEVPGSACQSLLESIPEALMPTVRATHMIGTFGLVGRLSFDSSALDELDLLYRIDDRCHFADVPKSIDRERFRKPFMHRIVRPDGSEAEIEAGPDSAGWTSLESISPFMQAAVLTTEDGAFFKHHGFNHAAIKSAIVANLKARRFVRGASTISMQLAKNLFLSRQKTMARKLEEVVLTDYLEQTFSKEELIELYLNIVEFGPDIYGITAAADHYFGRKPEELNLMECMFLATLLPRPLEYHSMYERGAISEGWAKNLHSLIEISFRTGKISEAERNEALAETIVFYKEGDPRPAPRPPVIGGHFGNVDEEWKVIE